MTEIFDNIKPHFQQDGTRRDFKVLDADLSDWDSFLKAIPTLGCSFRCDWSDGEHLTSLPPASALEEMLDKAVPTISIEIAGCNVDVFFFDASEIEISFWPEDFASPSKWGELSGFFQAVTNSIGKRGFIGYENSYATEICHFNPEKDTEQEAGA